MQLGQIDIYVAKFDASGNHLASRVFGSDLLQAVTAVALDEQDNILLSGASQGPLDFGTGPVGAPDPMVTGPILVKLGP